MKDKIVEAAIQQILRFGFRKFTIDDITAQLGISKKTVYKYFDSKRSLIAAAIDQYLALDRNKHSDILASGQGFRVRFENLITSDTHAMVPTYLLTELQQFFPDLWEKCACSVQVNRDESIQLYQDGIAGGEICSDLNPAIINLIVEKAIDGVFDSSFLTRYDLTIKQALQEIKRVVLSGILAGHRQGEGGGA